MNLYKFVLISALFTMFAIPVSAIEGNSIENLMTPIAPPKMLPKPDFDAYTVIPQRKKAFVDFMNPGIRFANEQIEKARWRLQSLQHAMKFSEEDILFLNKIAKLFHVPVPNIGIDVAWFEQVLDRVDVMPIDLVLSQAAIESGWGTSRFARQGNNYFGQWCYSAGCGMVPKARGAGQHHEVAVFADPFDSIQSYYLDVNRNNDYADLRRIRSILRQAQMPITGEKLVEGLKSYSQRGQRYVDEVKEVLINNKAFWI